MLDIWMLTYCCLEKNKTKTQKSINCKQNAEVLVPPRFLEIAMSAFLLLSVCRRKSCVPTER